MDINKKENKMNNKDATFNNNGDVINGEKYETNVIINYTCDYNIMELTSYKNENYSEFYKRYISKFEEMKDYAVSVIFPEIRKKTYDFTSNTLIFGKKIIDWIYGLSKFPSQELKLFYNELKKEFDFEDNSIIVKRWNANMPYFNGSIQETIKNYNELYEKIIKNESISLWFKDDVCIDGRNISIQYEKICNKEYDSNDKFQKSLDDNKHRLSYPDVDRIKSEIFSNMLKHLFNNKNKPKNTIIFGIGLKECFEQIQNLTYIAIFYGSITHLRLIRELISNVMYMYADTFDDEKFYYIALKMLFLSGEFKKFKKLYDKIKLNYSFVNSDLFLKEMIDSQKSLFEFEKDNSNIFFFVFYGKYVKEDLYRKLEEKMLDIIKIDDHYQVYLISNAFRAIGSNIKRFNNISLLLKIIEEYFEKSYIRFYNDFGPILNEISIECLSDEEFLIFQEIVDYLILNKKYVPFDFLNCIIKIKQRDSKILKYDNYLNSQGEPGNVLYQLKIKENEFEAIKIITKIFKERHEKREKNPGSVDYGTSYNIGSKIFQPGEYNSEVRKFILNEYLPISTSIILSRNESIKEKIKHIMILSYILKVESDSQVKENIMKSIHESIECSKSIEDFIFDEFNPKNLNDLKINVMMCDAIMLNLKYEHILNYYIEILINHEENAEEILKCVKILNNYLQNKTENILDKLYILFNICFKINNINIRNQTVIMTKVFNNTEYQEQILKKLEQRAEEITFEECGGYINLIRSEENKEIYSNIINLLKNNKNYYIKYVVEKYL